MSCFYMYDSLPSAPSSNTWYASWSTASPCVEWTQAQPSKPGDGQTSWVVGVVDEDNCPSGARMLSSTGGGKSLPPKPALRANSISDFETQFVEWADGIKSFDLSE